MQRCQPLEGDVRLWKVLPPDRVGAGDRNERYSACTWRVTKQAGQVHGLATVESLPGDLQLPFEPSFRPRDQVVVCDEEGAQREARPLRVRMFLSLEEGYLVGYDSGEWGGGLYWYDRRGQLRQMVDRENVLWMFELPFGVLVFSGIDHLGLRSGHVRVLRYSAEHQWSGDSIELPGAPMALLFESEESALVAVRGALLRVQWGPDASVRVLHEAIGDWLAVTSIEKEPDGTIFLGMSHAVVRLTPTADGYREEWLVPERARSRQNRADGGGPTPTGPPVARSFLVAGACAAEGAVTRRARE